MRISRSAFGHIPQLIEANSQELRLCASSFQRILPCVRRIFERPAAAVQTGFASYLRKIVKLILVFVRGDTNMPEELALEKFQAWLTKIPDHIPLTKTLRDLNDLILFIDGQSSTIEVLVETHNGLFVAIAQELVNFFLIPEGIRAQFPPDVVLRCVNPEYDIFAPTLLHMIRYHATLVQLNFPGETCLRHFDQLVAFCETQCAASTFYFLGYIARWVDEHLIKHSVNNRYLQQSANLVRILMSAKQLWSNVTRSADISVARDRPCLQAGYDILEAEVAKYATRAALDCIGVGNAQLGEERETLISFDRQEWTAEEIAQDEASGGAVAFLLSMFSESFRSEEPWELLNEEFFPPVPQGSDTGTSAIDPCVLKGYSADYLMSCWSGYVHQLVKAKNSVRIQQLYTLFRARGSQLRHTRSFTAPVSHQKLCTPFMEPKTPKVSNPSAFTKNESTVGCPSTPFHCF